MLSQQALELYPITRWLDAYPHRSGGRFTNSKRRPYILPCTWLQRSRIRASSPHHHALYCEVASPTRGDLKDWTISQTWNPRRWQRRRGEGGRGQEINVRAKPRWRVDRRRLKLTREDLAPWLSLSEVSLERTWTTPDRGFCSWQSITSPPSSVLTLARLAGLNLLSEVSGPHCTMPQTDWQQATDVQARREMMVLYVTRHPRASVDTGQECRTVARFDACYLSES